MLTLQLLDWEPAHLNDRTNIDPIGTAPPLLLSPDLRDYNLQLTHKEPNDVRRDLWLARHPGGHSASPSSGVPDPDVLDHDATVHVREAKVLESATLRLSVGLVKLYSAAIGGLPLTLLIALVSVTHQGGSLVCLLQY